MKKAWLVVIGVLLVISLAGCSPKYLGKQNVTYVYDTKSKKHGKSETYTLQNVKYGSKGSTAYTFKKDGTYYHIKADTTKFVYSEAIWMFGTFEYGKYKMDGQTAKLKPSFYLNLTYMSDIDDAPNVKRKGPKSNTKKFNLGGKMVFTASKAVKKDDKKNHTTTVYKPVTPITNHIIDKYDVIDAAEKYLDEVMSAYYEYGE